MKFIIAKTSDIIVIQIVFSLNEWSILNKSQLYVVYEIVVAILSQTMVWENDVAIVCNVVWAESGWMLVSF